MIAPTDRPDATRARSRRRWVAPAVVSVLIFLAVLSPLWAPLLLRPLTFFRVRHVQVVGARYVDPRDIIDRLKVDTLASVWDATEPLEARVATHPLVREVDVSRRLPGTLVVTLVEHAPLALVPTAGGFRAYDGRGVALPIDPTRSDVDAPILTRADTAVLRLLAAVRERAPELYERLSEVRFGGGAGGGGECWRRARGESRAAHRDRLTSRSDPR